MGGPVLNVDEAEGYAIVPPMAGPDGSAGWSERFGARFARFGDVIGLTQLGCYWEGET